MLKKILSSNWVAVPVLVLAGVAVVLLYMRGRLVEAKLGGTLLGLAVLLILWGSRRAGPEVKD